MAVWNDAEAPEPPANLTATLKGAVIHRFCETFAPGDDPVVRLRQSFADLIRLRQAQFADRLIDIDTEKAVNELLPLANNYLSSALFERVNKARAHGPAELSSWPGGDGGLWSELGFRLRRPLGILTGAIDKLLITPSSEGFDVEIIDFKTNRFRARDISPPPTPELSTPTLGPRASRPHEPRIHARQEIRSAFDFAAEESAMAQPEAAASTSSSSLIDEVAQIASDYQLQMQAYALAVRELLPELQGHRYRLKVTLHFLDPNVEYSLPQELLSAADCARSIDAAMTEIVAACDPENFPVNPARHCRMCNFLEVCAAGREWAGQNRY